MNGWLARAIDDAVIASVVARGVETPRPFRPPVERSGVSSAPVPLVGLPDGPPGKKLGFRFDSAVVVGDGSGDQATGLVVRPDGVPRRGVLLVPGWLARFRPWFGWLARRLARQGAVVVLLDLPAHHGRTPPGGRHGLRLLAGDPALTDLYLSQAVSDARGLLRALSRLAPEVPPVAVGFSLGGFVAGTAAALEPGTAAILVTPAADPGRLLGSSPLLAAVRRELRDQGADPGVIADRASELALHRRPPPSGGALLIAGEFDRVIPLELVRRLADDWDARLDVMPVGHMTPYVSPRFVRRLERAIVGAG